MAQQSKAHHSENAKFKNHSLSKSENEDQTGVELSISLVMLLLMVPRNSTSNSIGQVKIIFPVRRMARFISFLNVKAFATVALGAPFPTQRNRIAGIYTRMGNIGWGSTINFIGFEQWVWRLIASIGDGPLPVMEFKFRGIGRKLHEGENIPILHPRKLR